MAKKKYDMMIESVRYTAEGNILLARGYQRRGDTYSDHILLDRQALVQLLHDGKRIATVFRKEYLGSTFEIKDTVSILEKTGNEVVLTSGQPESDHDYLKDVPVF